MTAEPRTIGSLADVHAIEARPIAEQWGATSLYEWLSLTAKKHPQRPALSFQLRSGPRDPAETYTWADLHARVTQTANMLRQLGLGHDDTVALLLPNLPETAVALLAGMTAGIVAPINPLLDPAQIGALLRETNARILITLAPFVRTDIAQKAALAIQHAPACQTVLEVGMARHLTPPLRWIAPMLAPKRIAPGTAKLLDFAREQKRHRSDALDFTAPNDPDAVCAYFHTGGTTGAPKVAVHRHRGGLYNGWIVSRLLLGAEDAVLCPLPLFHVLAAYPMLAACVASGAHFVMPTPAGYRGDGVMDNFWKLCARWQCTFFCTVPTAVAALMQRPVDADISRLNYALCGSAPMPRELFRRFEKATGVRILEGYGQTETTCLISCNPAEGERKIGSVGFPLPYTEVQILHFAEGTPAICGVDEIGEICVRNPGCVSGYLDTARNTELLTGDGIIRTGDLGRIDADGYLWITGRLKDLIVRGGHNIDPAIIEEALTAHEDVAFVGAVAQPDAYAGELPCAYVELRAGAQVDGETLRGFAAEQVSERAARPAHVEVLTELPKTAVGKVFKPALRARALERVYGAALAEAGIEAVIHAEEDRTMGLVAHISPAEPVEDARIDEVLHKFVLPWLRSA